MNHKVKVLLTSYGAAAIFVAAGLIFTATGGAEGYRLSQDNEYRRAMAQLVSSVSQADAALEKGQYASGAGMTGQLCAELMGAAQSASTALSILPLETYALEEVAGFLSQLEEYARVKGAQACDGTGFDDADRKVSAQLRAVTSQLVPALGEMYTQLSEGALSIRGWNQQSGLVTDEPETYLEDEILALLADFPETPELVYAGKLSSDYDSSYTSVSRLKEVTEEEAQTVAEKLMDGAAVEAVGASEGDLPCYYFTAETEEGTQTVAVTRQGGVPAVYLQEYTVGEVAVSEEEARQAAETFLTNAGFENLREESSHEEFGELEVIYAYADGQASYLADAVRVTVAMDTGKVIAMDASEYLHNHGRSTAVKAPDLTADEAAEKAIPEGIRVQSHELTWFTGKTGQTTMCWKFTCLDERGDSCVIYADADSGVQVEIRTGEQY